MKLYSERETQRQRERWKEGGGWKEIETLRGQEVERERKSMRESYLSFPNCRTCLKSLSLEATGTVEKVWT